MITIEKPDPHCIGWVRASAALYGMSRDHDLDEPVLLSEPVFCRVRLGEMSVIADREIVLKAWCTGHHVALRFTFKDGSFYEVESGEISSILNGQTATVDVTRPTLRGARGMS